MAGTKLFDVGQVKVTTKAEAAFKRAFPKSAIAMALVYLDYHVSGTWHDAKLGADTFEPDVRMNNEILRSEATKSDRRSADIFAAYILPSKQRIWIRTNLKDKLTLISVEHEGFQESYK